MPRKAKAKKPLDLNKWLIHKLRRLSLAWPPKNEVKKKAKVKREVGVYKNGKTKFRVFFVCNSCKGEFLEEETKVDHINPVIDFDGFEDWNKYIRSLFCPESNLQVLCKACHDKKSIEENAKRRK